MSTDTRLDSVERQLENMALRLRRLEGEGVERATPPGPPVRPSAPPPRFDPAPPVEPDPDAGPRPSLEELLGGRVLAWVGGLAILLGAVLFMGMAISHDWIDEATRTVIALIGSTALLVAGVWLYERKGRVEAALAAVASALSALYATLLVATQTYELISPELGLAMAALIAAVGLIIAVRWSSTVVAAIGALGALAAPLLVGTGASGTSIAFVAVALAGTVGVLIWQRWDWLALGAFAISAPQLIGWVQAEDGEHLALVLAVLLGFWALYVIAAFGHELRTGDGDRLPIASWMLLLGSAALVVGVGYLVLDHAGSHDGAVTWILGFSAAHILLGEIAMRWRINREIGALLIAVGLGLSALGLAAALDGPALVLAWSAESIVLAYLATRVDATPGPALSNAERLLIAASAFLILAFGHVLAFEAPPAALIDGVPDLAAAIAGIAAFSVAALGCGRLASGLYPLSARIATGAGAAGLVYLGSVAIVDTIGLSADGEVQQAGQVWLSAFWTATGLAAVVIGLVRRSASVRIGGLALLGVAIAKVWTYDLSELDEIARVLSFVGLGLLLLAGAFAYQRIRPAYEGDGDEARE